MSNEEIYIKIQKLLRLAENNPSKEEAASAFAKAQALMTEHKIEKVSVEDSVEEDEIFAMFGEEENATGGTWKYWLCDAFAKANGVYIYQGRKRVPGARKAQSTIGVVGKPSNIRAVSYLFQYCVRQIEELSKRECTGLGKAYANAFKYGCVEAVKGAIARERNELEKSLRDRAAASNDCKAVMVLNNSLAKINAECGLAEKKAKAKLNLRSGGYGGGFSSNSGYAHGRSAGQGVYPGGASGRIGAGNKRLN